MESLIYLDTHVVIWLFLAKTELLTETARRLIDENELVISPAVLLELQFFFEIGRLRVEAGEILESLHLQLALRLCDLPFGAVVAAALGHPWTRDPFDRLIVGQASARKEQLLTRDETMRDNFPLAVW